MDSVISIFDYSLLLVNYTFSYSSRRLKEWLNIPSISLLLVDEKKVQNNTNNKHAFIDLPSPLIYHFPESSRPVPEIRYAPQATPFLSQSSLDLQGCNPRGFDGDSVPRGVLFLSLSGRVFLAGGRGAGPARILLHRSSWED